MVVVAVVAPVAATAVADIVVAVRCRTSAAAGHPNCQNRRRDKQEEAVQPMRDLIGARWRGCNSERRAGSFLEDWHYQGCNGRFRKSFVVERVASVFRAHKNWRSRSRCEARDWLGRALEGHRVRIHSDHPVWRAC